METGLALTAIQSPYAAVAGEANSLTVLTTEGDILYENATPANARLAVGSVNEVLTSTGSLPEWSLGMILQATTGESGYSLINGTGTIISWTAPADSNIHRVKIPSVIDASSAVGGAIELSYTLPNGTATTPTPYSAGQGSGIKYAFSSFAGTDMELLIEAGSTVSLIQSTALTGGSETLWAEIWGS